MSKLVSALFKIARMLDTAEMVGKGKGFKRLKNKVIGKQFKKLMK